MTSGNDNESSKPVAAGSECSAGLGDELKDAVYFCLVDLASIDTRDTNLRDHPEAWAAIDAFVVKVRAIEKDRIVNNIINGSQFFLAGIAPEMREAVVRRAIA